ILTVLVLIYALMSFQLHGNMVEGRHYILMVDNSASMNATDVGPNRLEQAKKEAIKEIDAHTDNDTGMVIVFNSSAEILQSYTHDRSLLRRAGDSIQPTQPSTPRSGRLGRRGRCRGPTASPTRRAPPTTPPRDPRARTRPRRAPMSPARAFRPRSSSTPTAASPTSATSRWATCRCSTRPSAS